MLQANELDHQVEQAEYFVNLKAMGELIRQSHSKRNHKYDGRFKNKGMSKLLIDIHYMSELNVRVVNENANKTGNLERVENIIKVTAEECGIAIDYMKGSNHTRIQADARHIAAFISRMTTSFSLSQIGKQLTNGFAQDHSTVIHGCQCVVDKLGSDEAFTHTFDNARNKLKLLHGIEFNLEDWTKFPDWYRRMREK